MLTRDVQRSEIALLAKKTVMIYVDVTVQQQKILTEVNKVFQGVMVSVILFVLCASVCAFTACVYCCRINYTDRRLQSDVEALASKLKRECRLRTIKKTPTKPAEESCNIVVADADIYVV
ncbi:unnamed protein product [Danaus chrysippus]|uniref:(African queen) hypothetical protein n=1 Tax=Danaus chrysippus TaxID=151541 RepID=A0A8J2QV74_9NEOP|nr:unnamed protein product [Danaus chrysippus]